MTKQTAPVQPVNLKEQNARHTFTLNFRDTEHFYKVVNWMNLHVGKGSDKWTTQGRVKKHLMSGKSYSTKVYVFVDQFDESSILFLSLI